MIGRTGKLITFDWQAGALHVEPLQHGVKECRLAALFWGWLLCADSSLDPVTIIRTSLLGVANQNGVELQPLNFHIELI